MTNEVVLPRNLISEIREIMNDARKNIARQVNNEQLLSYWNIGRVIVEYEQNSNERADYGKETLKQLSHVLTQEFGKGSCQTDRRLYAGAGTWVYVCRDAAESYPQ